MSENRWTSDPQSPTPQTRGRYVPARVYRSTIPLPVANLPAEFSRADIEFIGVDHSGASFEARVFVNNPNADINTPPTEAAGFAGCFSVFGHGGCFGDIGHCDLPERRDNFDPRPSHPLMPMKKIVVATTAIKNALAQSADINVTVVPVIKSWTEKTEFNDVLKFDHINLITYK